MVAIEAVLMEWLWWGEMRHGRDGVRGMGMRPRRRRPAWLANRTEHMEQERSGTRLWLGAGAGHTLEGRARARGDLSWGQGAPCARAGGDSGGRTEH